MVARQLTPLFLADLDGTLVKGNTLHEFVRLGLRLGGMRGRMAIVWWSMLRQARLISHAGYKWRMARVIDADGTFMEAFRLRIGRMINKDVAALLALKRSEGQKVLIATAAFDFYVGEIVEMPYVATRYRGNHEKKECRGRIKADEIGRWARENGCYVAGAITDMPIEDAPMLGLAPEHERYVVDASGTVSRLQS